VAHPGGFEPALDLAGAAQARPWTRGMRPWESEEYPGTAAAKGRWILCHMIEEYARHNGHADLLREPIDGATGE
jgi:hypothetical protein